MEQLAAETRRRFPDVDHRRLADIRFDKFLFLDGQTPSTVQLHVAPDSNGSIHSALTTRFKATGTSIRRTLTHAALTVGETFPAGAEPALETMASLAGPCTPVDPGRIYHELVPFGPAYRNIIDTLLISTDGALARVGSPQPADPRGHLCLGSPYVLDAAFHAACVWAQRFRGVVAFPVALDRRRVIRPTRLDEVYTARVVPVKTDMEPYVFDIYIFDESGGLREAAEGVRMRDVSGGRVRPPDGFHRQDEDPLAALRERVSGLVLIERAAVAAFATAALSQREKARMASMVPRRAAGYLSARLALKRLGRMLSGDGDPRGACQIETVAESDPVPRCPLADGRRPFCSVSHDPRFTVAVVADRPVGVDVEPLSPKPLKATGLYMQADEAAMVEDSPLGRTAAALRIWSAKEAAAKALAIDLADAWTGIRVTELADRHSRLKAATGMPLTAYHAVLEGHVFTLLSADDRL